MAQHHITWCSAARVSKGYWAVGGSIPAFGHDDKDRVSVSYWEPPLHLKPVDVLVAKDDGGYDSMRSWLVEHGFLTPYFRRSFETPEETLKRRFKEARRRLRAGLPVSIPNSVGPLK